MSSAMNNDAGAAMGAGTGTGRGDLPPLRPACKRWSKDTCKVIDPPAKKKRQTPLPVSPRRREGTDALAASQPGPKNSRTSAPRTANSTPFLPSSGTSKYKKLKPSTSDKGGKSNGGKNNGGKSNGREQLGDGFSKDENRNTGGPHKRRAGDDNSFLDEDDLDLSRFFAKRRRTEDNGELRERVSDSSDATVDNDTSGPVQHNDAAAAQSGTVEVAQQDAAIEETAPAIEETAPAIEEATPAFEETTPVIEKTTPLLTLYSGDRVPQTHSLSMFSTELQLRLRHAHVPYTPAFATRDDAPAITEAPEVTESVIIMASAQQDTQAAGMESSGNEEDTQAADTESSGTEPILPGDSCIATAGSSVLQV